MDSIDLSWFDLPFHEYMARRTKFAIDKMTKSKVIDIDYSGISLMQAHWARAYWLYKNGVKGDYV